MTAPTRVSTRAALGWGVYVAVSWTWVIGMFLPVLLVRDFGLLGWAAFAVPNVIGAAAVGFVMKSPRQSAEVTVRHAKAFGAFTVVTIAMQAFTLAWLATRLVGPIAGVVVPTVAVLLATLGRRVPVAIQLMLAGVVWLISATIGVAVHGWLSVPTIGEIDGPDLAGLAVVCTLGFLTCPFLDVTLQFARQATGDRSRLAFGFGFGGFFLAMIALTLGYATLLPGLMRAEFDGAEQLVAALLVAHLATQVTFTMTAHLSAIERLSLFTGETGIRPAWTWTVAMLVLAAFGVVLGAELRWTNFDGSQLTGGFATRELLGYTPGELVYRGFLGFFGLIFPTYVLVVMVARRSMRACALVIAVAAPFMAVAFFGGPSGWTMGWAIAGGAVLVVPLAFRKQGV